MGNTCTAYYFSTSFSHAEHTTDLQVIPLPGDEVAVGCIKGNSINVVKLTINGDTTWNKLYTVAGSAGGQVMKGLLDLDGSLLFAVNSNYVIKIDTSGKLLSCKTIQSQRQLTLFKMALLSSGDKVIMFSNYPYAGALLVRYDKDLSMVKWCKYYSFFNPSFGDFCVDQDNIIFAGGCAESEYDFNLNSFIGKIDGVTGNVLQFKYYKADNSFSRINGLYICGNDYIANCHMSSAATAYGTRAFIRFDKQLQIKTCKRITGYSNAITPSINFRFLPQPDGSFYIAYGQLGDLSLMYIDNADVMKWVKDMPGLFSYPSDIERSGNNGAIYIAGQANFFNMALNDYGSTSYVIKCDKNGNAGNCGTEQYPKAFLSDCIFSIAQNTIGTTDDTLSTKAVPVSVMDYAPDTYYNCKRVSNCDSLHLEGNSFTCNNAPVTITAKRNSGCADPIIWSVSPADGTAFQNDNDSTLSVVFSKSGIYKIKGAISIACADTIRDSLAIHVNLPGALDIGPDTSLCPNTILVLHAGSQFNAYTWQDGSTDSTYNVITPGRYRVTVTDYCNNIYSDSINIFSGASYNFHVNNDTSKCNDDSLNLVAPGGFTNYKWYPDDHISSNSGQTVNVFPSTDTNYMATAISPAGCLVEDTIHISVNYSPRISLGDDTSLCIGQSLPLNAGTGFKNYTWSTGESASQITVNKAGTYSIWATAPNACISRDTLIIKNVYPLPVFSLGNDTSLCERQDLGYNFNLNGASYLWNDGITSGVRTIAVAGNYWLKITQQGCSASDTLQVGYRPLPVVNLGNDTTLCQGDIKILNAENRGATYKWQDVSIEQTYTVSTAGTYYVFVALNSCSNSDTITVKYKVKPYFVFTGNPFICNGQPVTLSPSISDGQKYLWQDSTTASSLQIRKGGTYTLTVSNECGSYSNSIVIVQGDCQLNMPNAFTPGNDGLNDIFRVKYPGFIKSFHMTVFNRLGGKVFETSDVTSGWDGKLNSRDQPMGAYVWIISLTNIDGITGTYKGTVILIR
ncbi:MAG: gliding motility-associated C-terminal domain-containing protein [Ginsengibacter sp.]